MARTLSDVRYEARAYGTRQEIIDHITVAGKAPGRSEEKMRAAVRAVLALEDGACEVEFSHVTYVVEEVTETTS